MRYSVLLSVLFITVSSSSYAAESPSLGKLQLTREITDCSMDVYHSTTLSEDSRVALVFRGGCEKAQSYQIEIDDEPYSISRFDELTGIGYVPKATTPSRIYLKGFTR